MKARTSYKDHGYDVIDSKKIFVRYTRTWFPIDLISAIPLGLFRDVSETVRLLTLLRLLRIGRLLRKLDALAGANYARVVQMMVAFVLLGHWFGLLWCVYFACPTANAP